MRETPKHFVYIHVYMCVYTIYICVYVYMYIYIHVYVCTFFKLREVSDHRDGRSGFVKK